MQTDPQTSRPVCSIDAAVCPAHHLANQGQTESSPGPGGRKMGIEEVLEPIRRDSSTVVLDLENAVSALLSRTHDDLALFLVDDGHGVE